MPEQLQQEGKERLEIFPRKSKAYKAHLTEIERLRKEAQRLQLLHPPFRDEILVPEGIVCNRPQGDEQNSVAKSFFGLALWVLRTEERSNVTTTELNQASRMRHFLYRVLSMRLSIEHHKGIERDRALQDNPEGSAIPPVDFTDDIKTLEQFCEQHHLPSLLPNLFSIGSLLDRMKQEPFNDRKNPQILELWHLLSVLYPRNDRILHSLCVCMAHQGRQSDATACLEAMADYFSLPLKKLFRRNSLLLEAYVVCLFEEKRYPEVVEWVERLEFVERLPQYPLMLEKYLRALRATKLQDEAQTYIDSHPGIVGLDETLDKTIAILRTRRANH